MKIKYILLFILICACLTFLSCGYEFGKTKGEIDGDFKFYLLEDGTYAIAAAYPEDCPEVIKIPTHYNGVPITKIQDDGFYCCKNVLYIIVPEGIKIIPRGAFLNCPNLKRLDLPSSINEIRFASLSTNQPLTIHYNGTAAEWYKIVKYQWAHDVYHTIICTDQTITDGQPFMYKETD